MKHSKRKYPLYLKAILSVSLLSISVFTIRWALERHESHESRREESEEGEKEDVSPSQWHLWFMKGRKTRDRRPAAAHRLEAKAKARTLPLARPGLPKGYSKLSSSAAPRTTCDWTELGPSPQNDSGTSNYANVSGRVTSLALDLTNDTTGNTLYVGSAYGGVWKTTNGLSSSPAFTALSDPTQSLAMGVIALDTSHNPPYIYVGTGEANMSGDSYYGVGILESQNGGSSWSLVSTANSGAISFLGMSFSKILVDPTYPATILAGTVFSCCDENLSPSRGIFRSTDSGATWTQVPDSDVTFNITGAQLATHSVTDIIYEPSSSTYYAGVRGEGIFSSTNYGVNWTQLASPFPAGVTATLTNFGRVSLASHGVTLWALASEGSDGGPATALTGGTGLVESDNSGASWHAINVPNGLFNAGAGAQGFYDQYVDVPPGTSKLVLGGIDTWVTSAVNATSTSWTNLTNSYGGGSVHPDAHAIAFAAGVTWYIGNDGGVWNTTNSGSGWTDINNGIGTIQFYGVSPDPNNAGAFAGGSQDNGTAYTSGSDGTSWSQVIGGDGGFTEFNPSVPGELFGEQYDVGLYRSANDGADGFPFTVVDSSKIPDDSAFIVPYKLISGVPGQVVLGASHVWRGPANANNGSGWVSISQNLLGADSGNGFVIAVDTGTSNPNYIYASTEDDATGDYHLFGNGGAAGVTTWTEITGSNFPIGNPIAGLAVDPASPTTVYAGIQGFVGSAGVSHVYQTTNGGTSWTDITGNLPDVPVNWILVDPDADTDIYIATDVGVFYTNAVNGSGTSWAQVGTLLPDSAVLQIRMGNCPNRTLVATTHGRGAWSICPQTTYDCPAATPTFSPTVTPILVPFTVQAQPNVTDGRTPVNFVVGLPTPMTVMLGIFDIAGEAVYFNTFQENTGNNVIPWKPQNQYGQPLASGLYIYHLRATNGSQTYDQMAKILVRR